MGNPRLPGRSKATRVQGKSLTKASLGVGLETHEIFEKFVRTGELEAWNARQGRYGDWTSVGDYQDCLNRVLEAQESFEALPAEIRRHVENDPVKFLELVLDPARTEELRGLGLIPPGENVPPAGAAPAPGGEEPEGED